MTWLDEYDLILLRAWKKGATDNAIVAHMLELKLPICRADIVAARKRLSLRPHLLPSMPEPKPLKDRPNPRAEATIWLGERLTETADGFRLDGRPVNFYPNVIQEINRLRKLAGEPQLDADPRWVI